MFKRILLPTDGSELSERAVLAGVSFAKELNADVVGLTVLPEFHIFTYKAESLEETEDEFKAVAEQRAAKNLAFISDAARTADVTCVMMQDTSDQPWEVILRVAKERQCDLLLGSETQKVLLHSKIPVLVYR
jgi:nucleotide-binding universal stress UspA family protein